MAWGGTFQSLHSRPPGIPFINSRFLAALFFLAELRENGRAAPLDYSLERERSIWWRYDFSGMTFELMGCRRILTDNRAAQMKAAYASALIPVRLPAVPNTCSPQQRGRSHGLRPRSLSSRPSPLSSSPAPALRPARGFIDTRGFISQISRHSLTLGRCAGAAPVWAGHAPPPATPPQASSSGGDYGTGRG